MSEKEFELYLSLLSRFLRLKPGQRNEIADELRDHLEARLEELSRSGLSREEAIHSALSEFGDAAELADHFTHIAHQRKRRLIMRCTFGSIVALASTILIAIAFWPADPALQIPPQAMAQQERETNAVLTDPVQKSASVKRVNDERYQAVETKLNETVEVNLVDQPLLEVLDYIGEQIKVDILLNERSFLDAGIDTEETINFHLSHTDLTAATALRLILEKLDLTYRIRDGFVWVETDESAQEQMEVHVYNCRDLLEGLGETVEVIETGEAQTAGGGGGGGFFSIGPALFTGTVLAQNNPELKPTFGGGLFGRPDSEEKADRSRDDRDREKEKATGMNQPQPRRVYGVIVRKSPAEKLIDVIMSSTAGPWDSVDGEGGDITHFNGLLIVRNNQQAQRNVKQTLEMLRAANKLAPTAPVAPAHYGDTPEKNIRR